MKPHRILKATLAGLTAVALAVVIPVVALAASTPKRSVISFKVTSTSLVATGGSSRCT